jgi:hypothetical protein
MVDLIQWGRSGGQTNNDRVQVFPTVRALSEYSLQTGKIFNNRRDNNSEEGGGVFLHLLRHIFSPESDDHVFT